MLRTILNEPWTKQPKKHKLYGQFPPISKTIQDEQDIQEEAIFQLCSCNIKL